jgi:cysteine desulfurase
MSVDPIYFDYNATTPCDPQVVEAMLPYFSQHFGNASSKTHAHGWFAEDAVSQAREQVASLIGADAKEIIFTSGATESINLSIQGLAQKHVSRGKHIITVATEHKAVLDVCAYLEEQGYNITYLPVDAMGMIALDQLEGSIRKDTVLIAAMYANNETGVLHPVAAIGRIAQQHSIPFFCDATQAVGKIPVDVQADYIDMMAFSAHKMYGPKGTGALFIRKKNPLLEIPPLFFGGAHERKLRSGTLNVPGIVGMGKAAALCQTMMASDAKRLLDLRDMFWKEIGAIEGVEWNGQQDQSLTHVANICFDVEGGDKLIKMLSKHVSVSSGAACSSATVEPSHVLKAMGLSDAKAHSSIRFSFGRFTTLQEITIAIEEIKKAVSRLS